MWVRKVVNSGAGNVPIIPGTQAGVRLVRAALTLSANGTVDFQDGTNTSLNGGPLVLNAGIPLEIGYVEDDDAKQNPLFQTGPTPTDPGFASSIFPFPSASLDYDFANGRYQPALGLTTTRASVAYEDDLSGNWTSFAANTARITNKGLLVEEARTNGIRNNSMQGAVTGSPGTAPTNWTLGGITGITRTIVAIGTVNGIDYMDINYSGTNTSGSTQTFTIFTDTVNGIVGASGQTWTASIFFAVMQADPNLTQVFQQIYGTNGATATESFQSGNIIGGPFTSRDTFTATLGNAGTTNVQQRFNTSGIPNGATINWTIRIGWPQLELGAFATSPIRTTAAAVPRAADVVTVTSPPAFGSAITLFAAGAPEAPANYATVNYLCEIDDGTNVNRLGAYRLNGNGGAVAQITSLGLNSSSLGSWPANAIGKVAVASASADQAGLFNAGAIATAGQAGAIPATQIKIGNRWDGANLSQWNGYITRVAVWPNQRLPNATLQQLTGTGLVPTNGVNLVITGGTCTGFVDYSMAGN